MIIEFHQYYKLSLMFFLMTAINMTMFALGLEYSKDRNEDIASSNVPYFFPTAVAGGLTFIELVASLRIFSLGRKMRRTSYKKSIYTTGIDRMSVVLAISLYIALVWGIVGAALTGSHGLCIEPSDEEGVYRCYYEGTMYFAGNRAIAIVSICVLVAGTIVHFFLMFVKGSTPTVKPKGYTSNRKAHEITLAMKPKMNTSNGLVKSNYGQTNGHVMNQAYNGNEKQMLALQLGPDTTSERLQQQNGGVRLQPINFPKKHRADAPLKKHTSMFQIKTGGAGNADHIDSPPRAAPLGPPSMLKERSEDVVDQIRVARGMSAKRKRGGRGVPPPSYKDATSRPGSLSRKVSEMGPNHPYWLPPVPGHEADVPENMYTGTAYPDSELEPVHPATHVNSRRY